MTQTALVSQNCNDGSITNPKHGIAGAKSPLKAEWFNPQTGQRTDAGLLSNGTAKLTPPRQISSASHNKVAQL